MPDFTLPDQLEISKIVALSTGQTSLQSSPGLQAHLDKTHEFLREKLESGEQIYGVNTGFGPLVDRNVSEGDINELQHNLLQQLSCNTGPAVSPAIARGTMILRANALSKGRSAIRYHLLEQLINLINSGATPVIQRYGSVGASGDLIPLTRMARTLLGLDKLRLPNGTVKQNSKSLLQQFGVKPVSLEPKEGLALVNGTSYSCAITALSFHSLQRMLQEYAVPLSSTLLLIMGDSLQHLSPEIYNVKRHQSARQICSQFNEWLQPLKPDESHGVPQPPYSARSLVLWLGTVWQHLEESRETITIEMNSVDDNPLFFADQEVIRHAANFQGTYIAKAADSLSQASVKLSNLMERQLNRLLHDKLNGDLPAFLAPQPVGLHSGLQGFQLLATSLLSDMRAKAMPHSTQSFPTNQDNQDVVSMGANAAMNGLEIIRKTAQITAILECTIARALQIKDNISLPEHLKEWWLIREDVLEFDYATGDLSGIVEERAQYIMDWENISG